RSLAHDLRELRAARDADAAVVEHPRRLRAERAVHERLQVAEPQHRRARAAADADLAQVRDVLPRRRLPDTERQLRLLLQPLPEADRADPAVLVVVRDDAALVRELHADAHRLDVIVRRVLEMALLEVPRGLLAQHARRRAVRVALDDAAGDVEVAARER